MNENRKKLLLNVLKILFVLFLMFFIFKAFSNNWSEIKGYDYSSIDKGKILISLVVQILASLSFGFLWAYIIKGHGERIGLFPAAGIFFFSNMFRYIPGKVMQGVSMVYFATKRGIKAHSAISATVVHQVLFIISGLTISLFLLPAEVLGEKMLFLNNLRFLSLGMIVLVYPPVLNKIIMLGGRIFKRDVPRIELRFIQILLYYLLGNIIWLIYGVSLAIFVSAFTPLVSRDFITVIAIFPTGYVMAFMAVIAPGGIGIREGIFAFLLRSIITPPMNLTVSALTRLWTMSMEILVLIPFLIYYIIAKSKENQESKEDGIP